MWTLVHSNGSSPGQEFRDPCKLNVTVDKIEVTVGPVGQGVNNDTFTEDHLQVLMVGTIVIYTTKFLAISMAYECTSFLHAKRILLSPIHSYH